MGEWYYIGSYGQLGPLDLDQMKDLVEAGVITRDTFVWKSGMSDWSPASRVPELAASVEASGPPAPPPMPPALRAGPPAGTGPSLTPITAGMSYHYPVIPSDKSRNVAGILQLFPGFGRMYLGYGALGAMQFVLAFCMGVGFAWSLIDGILILSGRLKHDGYGRTLE